MQETLEAFVAKLRETVGEVKIEDVYQLKGNTENMKALQIQYPELSDQIGTSETCGYRPFEKNSYFIVGNICEKEKRYPFVNFVNCGYSNLVNGRNFIFIPGQGMQLYNTGDYNGYNREGTETFVHEINGIQLFMERSNDIEKRRVIYTSDVKTNDGKNNISVSIGKYGSASFDKEGEISVENGYPNRVQKHAHYVRFNNEGHYDNKGDKPYDVEYGYLYQSEQAKLPIRIYKKVNGNRVVYELNPITGKYVMVYFRRNEDGLNVSDSLTSQAPISFEEFEKEMIDKYEMVGVTNSELDKCFSNLEEYPIPSTVSEIIKTIRMSNNLESGKKL